PRCRDRRPSSPSQHRNSRRPEQSLVDLAGAVDDKGQPVGADRDGDAASGDLAPAAYRGAARAPGVDPEAAADGVGADDPHFAVRADADVVRGAWDQHPADHVVAKDLMVRVDDTRLYGWIDGDAFAPAAIRLHSGDGIVTVAPAA